MIIINVEKTETVSKSNGKTYYNYRVEYGQKKEKNGIEFMDRYSSNCRNLDVIDDLCRSGKIQKPEDLIGKDCYLGCSLPHYLNDFEKQYNALPIDTILIKK